MTEKVYLRNFDMTMDPFGGANDHLASTFRIQTVQHEIILTQLIWKLWFNYADVPISAIPLEMNTVNDFELRVNNANGPTGVYPFQDVADNPGYNPRQIILIQPGIYEFNYLMQNTFDIGLTVHNWDILRTIRVRTIVVFKTLEK